VCVSVRPSEDRRGETEIDNARRKIRGLSRGFVERLTKEMPSAALPSSDEEKDEDAALDEELRALKEKLKDLDLARKAKCPSEDIEAVLEKAQDLQISDDLEDDTLDRELDDLFQRIRYAVPFLCLASIETSPSRARWSCPTVQ